MRMEIDTDGFYSSYPSTQRRAMVGDSRVQPESAYDAVDGSYHRHLGATVWFL